jgi:plasmid stabilization system protein ParE
VSLRVELTREAEDDLLRLYDFLLEREAVSANPDYAVAERALAAIRDGFGILERFPFTCRKAGRSPFVRELVIHFGHSGYVALFEIVDDTLVRVGAVRHQREDDYR